MGWQVGTLSTLTEPCLCGLLASSSTGDTDMPSSLLRMILWESSQGVKQGNVPSPPLVSPLCSFLTLDSSTSLSLMPSFCKQQCLGPPGELLTEEREKKSCICLLLRRFRSAQSSPGQVSEGTRKHGDQSFRRSPSLWGQ